MRLPETIQSGHGAFTERKQVRYPIYENNYRVHKCCLFPPRMVWGRPAYSVWKKKYQGSAGTQDIDWRKAAPLLRNLPNYNFRTPLQSQKHMVFKAPLPFRKGRRNFLHIYCRMPLRKLSQWRVPWYQLSISQRRRDRRINDICRSLKTRALIMSTPLSNWARRFSRSVSIVCNIQWDFSETSTR